MPAILQSILFLAVIFAAGMSLMSVDGQIIRLGKCKSQGVSVQQNFTVEQATIQSTTFRMATSLL